MTDIDHLHPTGTSRDTPSDVDHAALLGIHGHTVFHTDADGNYRYLSGDWETLTGFTAADTIGRHFAEFVPATELDRLAELVERATAEQVDGVVRFESHFDRSDGERRNIQVTVVQQLDRSGNVTGAMGTLTDVTDRHRDELQLRHSQKMEAVGRLAAGIAHEINTPIQFIGDNLVFLSESFERVVGLLERYRSALGGGDGKLSWAERQEILRSAEDQADIEFVTSEVPEAVSSALEGTRRVAKIVRAMKAFDHPNRAEPQPVDLNEIISNTLIVSRNELKYVADVHTDLGELPTTVGDPSDLGQVFLNILVNAADAIREGGVGTADLGRITVRTWSEGDMVRVAVADTGPGVPAEIQDRLFDPFFTTKDVGKGTGQGLPLARALIERHGGSIWFESDDRGTTFHVALPRERVEAPAPSS